MATPNMTPGLVVLPGHNVIPFAQGVGRKVKLTTDWDNRGFDKLGPRKRRGIAWHRALGHGSVNWLLTPNVGGMADWVISEKADATMTQIGFLTGSSGDISGWTQGPWQRHVASADAIRFVDTHAGRGLGASIINCDLESIEVMGYYDDAIHDNTRRDLAQFAASRAHDDGIVWDKYPILPNGLTHNYGHLEFCGKVYKLCCGSTLWAYINGELIDRVEPILKLAQIGTAPAKPVAPLYRRATVPAFMRDPSNLPEKATLNGAIFLRTMGEYRVERRTDCYTSINSATRSRSSLIEGAEVRVWYVREDGAWGITAGGSRIRMSGLSTIVEIQAA